MLSVHQIKHMLINNTYNNLDINNVNARINVKWRTCFGTYGISEYEVPKGIGKTSNFTADFWIGG